MANRGAIRASILSLVSNHSMITSSDVNTIIDAEHETLLNDYSWSRRKEQVVVTTAAPYSTGTVSTSGTTVTGSGTAWTPSFVGRFIRIGSNPFFHMITAFGSPTSLTIESALPEDAAAGSAYTIFKHIYALPLNYGRVTSVTLDTRLAEWPKTDIDRIDPYRTSTASYPDVYALHGLDSGGVFQIEFWPVPAIATAIRIEYLKTNSLTSDTDSPLYRSDVLVWKGAESAAFFLHAKTGDQSWLALADRYHERYREALQGAREDDAGKYGRVSHVRDRHVMGGRGDDFWVNRDPLRLR